jgi:hypothetical protein
MRSGFEKEVVSAVKRSDKKAQYEPHRISYTPKIKSYTPDILLSNGMYIEVKGRFTSADRAKHLLIKKQHPNLDIRFVFQRSKQKLYKGSNTTYGEWCDRHGFKWADKSVPQEWIEEAER